MGGRNFCEGGVFGYAPAPPPLTPPPPTAEPLMTDDGIVSELVIGNLGGGEKLKVGEGIPISK